MKLDKKTEEKLKKETINYLKNCKPDWDILHTLICVDWMRKLIEKEGGDERILVTTMYLHDIGYPKMKKGYNFDDLIKAKKHHAEKGAEIAKKVLRKLEYSASEIKEIAHLIAEHYNKDNINSHNMQLVIEADGLAKIDFEKQPPNLDKKNCLRYLEYYKGKTAPKFKTKTGKKFLKKVLEYAENYWKFRKLLK